MRFFLALVMPMNGSDGLLKMVSNGQSVRQTALNQRQYLDLPTGTGKSTLVA